MKMLAATVMSFSLLVTNEPSTGLPDRMSPSTIAKTARRSPIPASSSSAESIQVWRLLMYQAPYE